MKPPEWPKRAKQDKHGQVVYTPDPYGLVTRTELIDRIERAKASLAYFGPQAANVVAILEGR